MRLSANNVRAALADLGGSGRAVEATLRRNGIRGERGKCRSCPVAKYLTRLFPGCHVTVGYGVVTVSSRERRIRARSPDGIMRFVEGFDCGDYSSVSSEAA